MADVAELGIVVELKDGQLVARTLDSIGDASERTERKAESLMSQWKKLAGVLGLGFLAHEELKNIIDAQNAMAELENATRSMGFAAGKTVNELDELSIALQKTTVFNDEAIKHAESLLLTFDKIRGDNFDRATIAVTNLAARMGGDLQGAALQVGKALQDPELGMNALRRSGVSFTEAQKEMIKTFNDTGQAAKAQEIILRELERQFGGSAAAARNTLGGALAALKNHFWDNFEITRKGTEGLVAWINKVDEAVQKIGKYRAEIQTLVLVLGTAGLIGVLNKLIPLMQTWIATTQVSVLTAFSRELLGIKAAFEVAAIGGSGLNGVMLGLSATITGMAAALAIVVVPLALLYREWVKSEQILDEAEEHLNKVLDDQFQKMHARNLLRMKKIEDDKAEVAAVQKLTKERQIEIDRQRDLNAAYGQGDYALKVINIRYDAMIQKRKDAEKHSGAELKALNESTDAMTRQQLTAARLEEDTRKMNDEFERSKNLSDAKARAFNQILAATKQIGDDAAKRAGLKSPEERIAEFHEYAAQRIAMMAKMDQDIIDAKIAKERAEREAIELPFKNAIENIQKRFADMFSRIFGRGKSVFQQLAGEIAAMFTAQKLQKLMAGMIGGSSTGMGFTNSSIIFEALKGPAMSGLAGYGIGYGIGSYTKNKTTGALGGALGGAAAGAMIAGPIGAAVGAVAGFVGGVIGAGKAAKEAAEHERQLREQYAVNIAQIKLLLGVMTPLQNALEQSKKQFADLEQQIQDAYAGKKNEEERNRMLAELKTLEAQRTAQLKEEAAWLSTVRDQEIAVRVLRATGHAEEADNMAFALAQQKEMRDAVAAGATKAQILALATVQLMEAQQREEALSIARKRAQEDLNLRLETALGLSEDEVAERQAQINAQREYEDAVRAGKNELYLATLAQTQHAEAVSRAITKVKATIEGLTQTISGLSAFRDTLALSETRTPDERLTEAKRQYQAVINAALGGDQEAASRIPQVAQTLLSIAQEMYASSTGFQDIFDQVQHDTNAAIDYYQAQKTAAEKQLEELVRIRESIREQTTIIQDPPEVIIDKWRRFPTFRNDANLGPDDVDNPNEILRTGFTMLGERMQEMSTKITESINVQRTGFEGNSI